MSAHISAARAVTAVFFQNLLGIGFWIATGILALLLAITAVLAVQISGWWWLLLIIFLPVYGLAIGIGLGLYALSNRVLPRKLTKDERSTVSSFTSNISGLIETAKTPYPIVIFLVAKDVIRGKRSRFLDENVLSSQSIKKDYAKIQRLF